MARVSSNIADHVGRTPMVRMDRLAPDGVELYGKLESLNPGGSVKDRIGVSMIEAAERDGMIEPGRTTIVEATSGNTGIALGFVCAAKGYELVLTLPQGMSREREKLLRLYGARVQITESMGGMDEAVQAARAMAIAPDVFLPDQFSNPANPDIHRRTTGPEILEALDNRVDVFVAGVGTGGTITGVGECLKPVNPSTQIVAVEPASSAVLSGRPPGPHKIQGIGARFVPEVLNREVLGEIIPVPDEAVTGKNGSSSRSPARSDGGATSATRSTGRFSSWLTASQVTHDSEWQMTTRSSLSSPASSASTSRRQVSGSGVSGSGRSGKRTLWPSCVRRSCSQRCQCPGPDPLSPWRIRNADAILRATVYEACSASEP